MYHRKWWRLLYWSRIPLTLLLNKFCALRESKDLICTPNNLGFLSMDIFVSRFQFAMDSRLSSASAIADIALYPQFAILIFATPRMPRCCDRTAVMFARPLFCDGTNGANDLGIPLAEGFLLLHDGNPEDAFGAFKRCNRRKSTCDLRHWARFPIGARGCAKCETFLELEEP